MQIGLEKSEHTGEFIRAFCNVCAFYIYLYIYVYKYIHVYTYTRVYIYICMYVYINIRTHGDIYFYVMHHGIHRCLSRAVSWRLMSVSGGAYFRYMVPNTTNFLVVEEGGPCLQDSGTWASIVGLRASGSSLAWDTEEDGHRRGCNPDHSLPAIPEQFGSTRSPFEYFGPAVCALGAFNWDRSKVAPRISGLLFRFGELWAEGRDVENLIWLPGFCSIAGVFDPLNLQPTTLTHWSVLPVGSVRLTEALVRPCKTECSKCSLRLLVPCPC